MILCIWIASQAFYNWAIAISDRAKMRGRTKEAEELWKQVYTSIPCVSIIRGNVIGKDGLLPFSFLSGLY